MYPDYTIAQFLAMLDIPSSADYKAVFNAIRNMTNAPISWEAPGDDAEYITELQIGEMMNAGMIVITFSKYGNLCFAYVPKEPLIAGPVLERVLNECGWILVPPNAANMVIFPATGARVHDCFFNYS